MGRRLALALAVVLVALSGGAVLAADRLILGRRLVVEDPTGNENTRSVLVLGRETATDVPGISDPRTSGATLTVIANGGTSTVGTYVLDASGWTSVGTTGFKYTGPTGADGDPVKKVIARVTPGGVALIKVTLRGSIGTQSLDVVPPNPGADGGFVLAIGGGDRYCVALGGAAGGTPRADTARLWKVTNATAEAGCPAPPTTTSTSSSSTSSTSTTSSTGPPVCGNGIVEAGEDCDGTAAGPTCPLESGVVVCQSCHCCGVGSCTLTGTLEGGFFPCCDPTAECVDVPGFIDLCVPTMCSSPADCLSGGCENGHCCVTLGPAVPACYFPDEGLALPCCDGNVCARPLADGFGCCVPDGAACSDSASCCSGSCNGTSLTCDPM